MKIEQQKSELVQEKRVKTLLLGTSSILLVSVFIQSFIILALLQYAHNKHEVHFLPPSISQEFTISASGVSESYLRDMSNFLTQLRFNVSAGSANQQFNVLLGYVASSLYGDIRAQLIKEVEQISHEHLSSVFYPTSFEMNMKHLSARVIGQMRRFVGAELMSDVREIYELKYSYESGLLKLISLEKV